MSSLIRSPVGEGCGRRVPRWPNQGFPRTNSAIVIGDAAYQREILDWRTTGVWQR